jgi:hypothetical protein
MHAVDEKKQEVDEKCTTSMKKDDVDEGIVDEGIKVALSRGTGIIATRVREEKPNV